jgi:hypothetical protein
MQVYDQFEIESKGEILGFKCFKKHFDQKLHSDVSKKYRQPKSPSTVPPPRNFSCCPAIRSLFQGIANSNQEVIKASQQNTF